MKVDMMFLARKKHMKWQRGKIVEIITKGSWSLWMITRRSMLAKLENMLDDIPGGLHKHFMEQYMKDWPYPHLTKYRVGQSLNAEYLGEQQRCEVQAIDCSLIQVVFQRVDLQRLHTPGTRTS